MYMEKKKILFVLLVLGLGLTGCGGSLTGGDDDSDYYTISAVLVKNVQTDSAAITVVLTKNADTITSAVITLDGDTLMTNSSGYYKTYGSGRIPVDTVYTLSITDSTLLDRDLSIRLASTPVITDAGFRFYTGSAEPVAWTGGANADGFILATKPPDDAAVDTGYSAYTGLLNGTIPSETFELDLNDRIIGTHMIYVVAYTGAPVEDGFIPFFLPSVLVPDDNITGTTIIGRTAGIVIALPDSISVSNP